VLVGDRWRPDVSEIELHADVDQVLGARSPDLGDLTGAASTG
jgi:hypothetical protein